MTVDIEKLEALALAATQGEWTCSDKHDGRFWHIGCGNQAIGSTHAASKKANPRYAEMFKANAKFIAAANPAAVLELIAELDEDKMHFRVMGQALEGLIAERDQLRAELAGLKTGYEAYERVNAELRAENELLRKNLLEASEEIANWGAYASDYFQEKHDLSGCVAKFHDAAMSKGASHD